MFCFLTWNPVQSFYGRDQLHCNVFKDHFCLVGCSGRRGTDDQSTGHQNHIFTSQRGSVSPLIYPWSLYKELKLPVSHFVKFNSHQNMSQLHTWQFTIVFLELIYNKIEVYNNNLCYIKRYINKGDLTHNTHLRNTHQPDALCLSRHNKNRLYACWSSTCTPYINTALKNKQCLFNFSPAFIESTSSHFLLREMLGVLIITAAQG